VPGGGRSTVARRRCARWWSRRSAVSRTRGVAPLARGCCIGSGMLPGRWRPQLPGPLAAPGPRMTESITDTLIELRGHCCIERSPRLGASTPPLKLGRSWPRSRGSSLSWRPSDEEWLHFAGLRQRLPAPCNSAARPPATGRRGWGSHRTACPESRPKPARSPPSAIVGLLGCRRGWVASLPRRPPGSGSRISRLGTCTACTGARWPPHAAYWMPANSPPRNCA
jgi:hypothetical protein